MEQRTSKATRSGSARLDGKVALIVGGASGIGAAAARRFALEGAAVGVADIRADEAEDVAEGIRTAGGVAMAFGMDVTRDESVQNAVSAVIERFGRLQVLFNCAGGSLPEDAPVTEVDLSVWDETINLDLRGTFLTCRHAIPHMIAAGGGAVVNMSSGAALRGAGKQHIYATAKGGVLALTRNLAGTYVMNGVRVNAICCGRINTERIRRTYGVPGRPGAAVDTMNVDERIKRYPLWFGEPDDIASVALFLASDESRMITGAAIPADGGHSAY
jgi:NAD(P)-dependent dehydrogenase (short-subunit alcohol dehydrogenase family)